MSQTFVTNGAAGNKVVVTAFELQSFLDILKTGRSGAVTVARIASYLRVTSEMVRTYARIARLNGVPIGANMSNPKGYYLIDEDADLWDEVASLRHRATEINRVADALAKAKV